MAQLKEHVYQHLHSAKEWLTKAENAFAKQHDIRAELDLMLAQAELQHAKEVNRSRQWRYKYVVFRHGLALTLAMCMVAILGGVYWWTTRPVLAVPLPVVEVSIPMQVPKVEEKTGVAITPLPIRAEENISEKKIAQEQENQQTKVAEQVVSQPKQLRDKAPAVLSDDEVQKLVRAAGKSLRGQ